MPTKNLEATDQIISSVDVGTISHKFQVGSNDQWEIYDYPGGYAQRFDGIDKAGSPQPADLNKIETDNTRTAKIRMEQEAVPGLVIEGESNVRRFDPGYKIKLKEHFNANGDYVLTDVEHFATMAGTYTTDQSVSLKYQNRFRSHSHGPALPAAARHAQADDQRHANGRRGGQRRLDRNRHRQIWPRESAILLGSRRQEDARQLLLGSRGAELGGQTLGRFFLPG